MQIFNRQKSALPSSMSPVELARAMSQLDLASIPPAKRSAALMDHLARIMVAKIHDRDTASNLATALLIRKSRQ